LLIVFATPFDLRDDDGLVTSPFAVGEEEAAAIVKRQGGRIHSFVGVFCFNFRHGVGTDAASRCSSALGLWEAWTVVLRVEVGGKGDATMAWSWRFPRLETMPVLLLLLLLLLLPHIASCHNVCFRLKMIR
jgi:hypothetical protein